MPSRSHQDIFAADIEWRPGSGAGIAYARFALDDASPDTPMVVLSRFDPGVEVGPHTHGCDYLEYVIAGEQTVGRTVFGAGDVRVVRGGTGYGPIRIGPEGCTVLIVFADASRSMTETLPRRKAEPADA